MTSSWFFLSTLYRPCLLRGTSVILIYNSSASDYLMTIFRGFPPSQSKCWVRVQIKRRTERFSSPQTINFRPNAATEKLRHFILMKTHPPHTQIQPQMLHFFPSLIIQSSPIPFTSTYSLPIVSILAPAYLYKTSTSLQLHFNLLTSHRFHLGCSLPLQDTRQAQPGKF